MTKAQREAVADLVAAHAREKQLFILERDEVAAAMMARHADERAALARKFGIDLAAVPAGTTGPAVDQVDGTTRAAAPVVRPAPQNGHRRRA